jgi:N-acetyl-gamma-glutamyl-phosphate reductase
MEYAPAFREKIPIIDLSGDYRLKTPDDYERWYRKPHRDGGALDRYVYGLPELNRDRIRGSRTIANPGCYPTAVLLALLPLVENRLVRSPVAVDAKSGHSGAGKKPSERLHAGNCAQNVQPYKVLNHQHVGEIEQVLGQCADRSFPVHFCPHLMPFDRGILCTVYAELLKDIENEELHRIVAGRYADHPFVRVFAGDDIPSLKLSIGTNFCDLHYTVDPRLGRVTVLSSIDNLLKGASGQAVQNMNLMLGFPEKEGLDA